MKNIQQFDVPVFQCVPVIGNLSRTGALYVKEEEIPVIQGFIWCTSHLFNTPFFDICLTNGTPHFFDIPLVLHCSFYANDISQLVYLPICLIIDLFDFLYMKKEFSHNKGQFGILSTYILFLVYMLMYCQWFTT